MEKYIRFADHGRIQFGRVAGEYVHPLSGAPWDETVTSAPIALGDVQILAPLEMPRIFGVAYNYANHAAEAGSATPKSPVLFMKPSTSVIGSGEPIIYPRGGVRVDYEGELAVVVGRRARNLEPENALEAVFGYTCSNDVSDRVIQFAESAFGCLLIGKGMDTFCPLGPCIVSGLDPSDLAIETRVNGAVVQQGSTANLLFGVRDLMVYISRYVTLLPGDVILSGTPEGIGPIAPGDQVDVEIGGIGILTNPVVAQSD